MPRLGSRVANFFRSSVGIASAITVLLLLPLDMLALTRITGWQWWTALTALFVLNLVPVAGQLIYICLAVAGAFFLGQDNLAERATTTASAPPNSNLTKPAETFLEWKRTVAAPIVQDKCIEDAKRRSLVDGKQVEQAARVCACYGAATINIVTEDDVLNGVVQPTPEFNVRLSVEARRLCTP